MFTDREHCGGMIDTVDAVVEELGGTFAVATLTGKGASAVSNWLSRGRIPAEHFLIVVEALRLKGKTVDPDLFGMTRTAAGADA